MMVGDNDVQFSWCLTGISIEVGDEKTDMILKCASKNG